MDQPFSGFLVASQNSILQCNVLGVGVSADCLSDRYPAIAVAKILELGAMVDQVLRPASRDERIVKIRVLR